MITKSGTRPIKKLPTRRYHERFVCGTGALADFNVDPGLLMQDQAADKAETECTCYYATDARTDYSGKIFTPDFLFGATMYVEGVTPNTGGADPISAQQAGVLRGFLEKSSTNISAAAYSELYVANWDNWPSALKAQALLTRNVDIHNALGNGDPYTSILNAVFNAKVGVGIVTPWYAEWDNSLGGGVLQMPADLTGAGRPWHMYAVKGQNTIAGSPCAITKSWQGRSIGDNGFLYMPPTVLNAILSQPGTCALIPIMTGSRFVPIVNIMLAHKKLIVPEFGQLFTT